MCIFAIYNENIPLTNTACGKFKYCLLTFHLRGSYYWMCCSASAATLTVKWKKNNQTTKPKNKTSTHTATKKILKQKKKKWRVIVPYIAAVQSLLPSTFLKVFMVGNMLMWFYIKQTGLLQFFLCWVWLHFMPSNCYVKGNLRGFTHMVSNTLLVHLLLLLRKDPFNLELCKAVGLETTARG